MRAPQYGHNRGKHRGKNPMSLPIGVRLKPSLVPVSGAITVRSLNKPVSISLWHKSADVMLGSGRKRKPNVDVSKDFVYEADRHLCAIPDREKRKSRNDTTRFYLSGRFS